jgi:hypothetical protein
MTKEHYFMNFTKEQLAVKLEELDKKYQRERSCDEILAKKLLRVAEFNASSPEEKDLA